MKKIQKFGIILGEGRGIDRPKRIFNSKPKESKRPIETTNVQDQGLEN